jgi:hypothetical protein
MNLPFDREQFLAVFTGYNEAVWPAQALLTAVAILAALLAWRPGRATDRIISGALAVLWGWMGVVYHFLFFRAINPAAAVFAAAFVLQAAAFVWFGVAQDRLRFRVERTAAGFAAGVLIVYALAVYPLVSQAVGHVYPAAPTFGLPCPTTIFTLGLLLAAGLGAPRVLLLVPLGWAALGMVAALRLGMVEDLGLPAAALVTAFLLLRRRKASSRQVPEAATVARLG